MATRASLDPQTDVSQSYADKGVTRGSGKLIINADDWGRDCATTDRTLECIEHRAVSSVSGMVFMEDSERAFATARDRGIDVGLHLNLVDPFTGPRVSDALARHQRAVSGYLRSFQYAQVIYHPGLVSSFRYSVAAQLDEFARLHGAGPSRIDGHHHMHLCANVVLGCLMPAGTVVRRNFSFKAGDKNFVNRLYRRRQDRALGRRHRMTDLFFSLQPLEPADRLSKVFSLADDHVIEVETHPVNPEEYRFLAGGEIFNYLGGVHIAPDYRIPAKNAA